MIYYYDKDMHIFLGAQSDDSWTKPDGWNGASTDVAFDSTLGPDARFENGAWRAATTDEHAAWEALQEPAIDTATTPTVEQQLLMQQAADITSLKQTVESQAAQIAELSKGSAS